MEGLQAAPQCSSERHPFPYSSISTGQVHTHARMHTQTHTHVHQHTHTHTFLIMCFISDNGANIYMKLPNFKQEVSKQKVMGSIIQSSKFPAAQKPDPNLPSKIETEYWPCPPSLAAMEIEWRKRKEEEEEGKDEFEVLTSDAKTLQEQELHKIKSNLGRLILKEEKEEQEKALLDIGRRKTQSLPDRTNMHTSFSLKVPSSSGLTRVSVQCVCMCCSKCVREDLYVLPLCRCSLQSSLQREIRAKQVGYIYHVL
uniref:Dematin actin binding protein n=1 Tax=Oncorhynchus mykiss TaxID=8022 RepID=A0A8L0DUM1_ONCMY